MRAVQPDVAGGDGSLFVWVRELHAYVCGDYIEDVRSAADRRRTPSPPGNASTLAAPMTWPIASTG
jgi:hypothetical protein